MTELIDRICHATPSRSDHETFSPKLLVPAAMRLTLTATARYLLNPKPNLPDARLLVRVLGLSILFRNLSQN